MAAIDRDAHVEAAIAAIDCVDRVEVAIAAAGLPGVRAARVAVVLRAGRADAVGPVVRAALGALRAAHGAAVTGSLALELLEGGERVAVPPGDAIAAAELAHAAAAGDELLFRGRTRAGGP